MSLNEEDLFDDLAFEEAEGAAESYEATDELDEFDEFDEADEFDAADEMEAHGEAEEFDEFDAFDELDETEEEDGFEEGEEIISLISRALSAEDSDEFFRRILRGLRGAARRVGRVARQAAPAVGQIARGAAPILGMIPHPYAQAAGRVANVVGRLMADGASEEEALEALSELAVRDRRALPIVAGLAVRSVARTALPQMPWSRLSSVLG